MKRAVLLIFATLGIGLPLFGQSAGQPNEGEILVSGTSAGNYTFSWWGKGGRTYFVETSPDILSGWTYLPGVIESGSEVLVSWGFATSGTSFFLKLEYTDDPISDPVNGNFNGFGISNADQIAANLDPLSTTMDSNGLPVNWELYYYGQTGVDPNAFTEWSAGTITNLEAFQLGLNPLDFYNSQMPVLTIVSGSGQTGSPAGFVSAPLVIGVTDTNGNPLYDAPINFYVASGGGSLQVSSTSVAVTGTTVFADQNGLAQVFFQLPNVQNNTSQVGASTGTAAAATSVTFAEFSDDGSDGPYPSPFSPSNVIGTMNADGSETITWQNNDLSSPIYIYQLQSSGTWTVVDTLAAGTVSYTIPGSEVGYIEVGNNYSPGGSTAGSAAPPGSALFTPIPVQSYAAIDVTGTLTIAVDAFAFDDQGNLAFSYLLGTSFFNYSAQIDLFQNGTMIPVQNIPLFWEGYEDYEVTGLDTSGNVFGLDLFANTGFESPAGSADFDPGLLYAPNPPYGDNQFNQATYEYVADNDVYTSHYSGAVLDSTGAVVKNLGGFAIVTPSGSTVFDTSIAGLGTSGSMTVVAAGFDPWVVNDLGQAYGQRNDTGDYDLWDGSSLVVLPGIPYAMNNSGQVVGIDDNDNDYIWTSGSASPVCPLIVSGTEQSISQLLPAQYQNEITNITPVDIGGAQSGGNVQILFEAQYAGSATAQPFLLTLTSTGSILQQAAMPLDIWDEFINAKGLIVGVGNLTGSRPYSYPAHALVLLPVMFTGTDADPLTDDGLDPGYASGFDGYTTPNWLMVPENASNSAQAYTPATSSLTIGFSVESGDVGMSVSPASTNTSPQTITVNAGYTSGASSQIGVGIPNTTGSGGELHVDVKQYQLKTVAMSIIAQQSGTNPLIYPTNAPTAAALQAYLNQVYGPQTNTYFFVEQYNYALNFDPGNNGVLFVYDSDAGGPEVQMIRNTAWHAGFDFNLYYVPILNAGGDSTGYSFKSFKDAVIGSNPDSSPIKLSPHELGHLFGLKHPEDPASAVFGQYDPTAPYYDLMHHAVHGTFLDHLQWDIVNPYNTNRL